MQRTANMMGGFVQATSPRRVTLRDAFLHALDGSRLQRVLAENVKPLPTYGTGFFARRPARLPHRRTVGTLFPQTDRLDDRLGSGWAAVAIDAASRGALEARGLLVREPGEEAQWLRSRGLTWAILRPDRFVFACGTAGDLPAEVPR
jgi:hypothetical protein